MRTTTMNIALGAAVVFGLTADASAAGVDEPRIEAMATEGTTPVVRMGARWVAGEVSVTEALPVGYPRPTAPEAVELKWYPSVRRAVYGGEGTGMNNAFWPLFRHISSRDIAMTAPVEMDLTEAGSGDALPDLGRVMGNGSMAFLYENPGLGPIGSAEDGVVVEDHTAGWMLSVGMRGRPNPDRLEVAFAKLESMVAQRADLKLTGARRTLGYNGPQVPMRRQWWEAQVGVERVEADPDRTI